MNTNTAECPFCTQPNAAHALVCGSCSRDIVVPATLISERDALVAKRDKVRDELAAAKSELERLRRRRRLQAEQG